ncbi:MULTISPECIES: hypothetical protein [unclassified Agrococcus]|uniref:hypothetical protein n=1 Tax=unclassified Agrococcus TaxID=2615065 RepID=UPI00362020FF
MRTNRRAAALWLPLVASAVTFAGVVGGCASGGGGGDLLGGGGGGEGATSWPASVPRPDLPLVEETDLIVAYTATYDLAGGSVDAYATELEDAGFAPQGQRTWADGEHVVLVETELGSMIVTITEA